MAKIKKFNQFHLTPEQTEIVETFLESDSYRTDLRQGIYYEWISHEDVNVLFYPVDCIPEDWDRYMEDIIEPFIEPAAWERFSEDSPTAFQFTGTQKELKAVLTHPIFKPAK